MSNAVQSAVGRLAAALRPDRESDEGAVSDLRNAVLAARLERAIDQALEPEGEGYEPLRPADRRRLAARLRG